MRPLLTLILLTCGMARASCALQQAHVTLPEYSAVTTPPATGSLNLTINCQGRDSALVYLSGPGVQTSGQNLQLQLRQGGRTLNLLAVAAAGLQGGLRVQGTQTLRFILQFPQGQWVPVGPYSAALTVTVDPIQP